jgi:4-coumarate--CoA ligase
MPCFDFAQFLKYNSKYRMTFFFTIPPMYLIAAKSPVVIDQFRSLGCPGSAVIGIESTAERAKCHGQLRRGVVFLDETPKGPCERIMKKDLRVLAKKEQGAKL